ncbi:MAG: hypothetical protein KA198_03445 [Chitinophagaceae bacterium]|nr:hypothetical protein [Chitinophagaceae bacterium]
MKKVLALLICVLTIMSTQAQRIKKLSGDPSPLSGEVKVNVKFTYENMSVGKFDKESDYIKKKKDEGNEKEAGKGDRWEESWKGDRKSRFEPNFIDLFMKNTPFALGDYPDAKYTMIINTSRTEPGYNIYVTKKNAEIDLQIKIIETSSKKEIAEYTVMRSPGRTFGGNDYDTGQRIEEAYAAAGKHFGKDLKKDMK